MKKKKNVGDIEAGYGGGGGGGGEGGGTLYPNMMENPQLRWAFIRKVYCIVALQIFLTIGVAAVVNFVHPVRSFLLSHTTASLVVLIVIIVAPILFLLPMIYFRERHPLNLILLMLFTICISMAVGLACATSKGKIILESAALTVTVVVGLTLYTFWAAKKGYDFNFLGPFLCAALMVMMIYCILQILIPMGKISTTIYGCLAAVIFSAFIIYDTDNLIKRHTYDQYVCAAISLYLDIINVFMALLTVLGVTDS